MIKTRLIIGLLIFSVVIGSIFAYLLFTKEKCTINDVLLQPHRIDDVAVEYMGDVIPSDLVSLNELVQVNSPYTKISSAYAIKDGVIYFIPIAKRYTANPEYVAVKGVDASTFTVPKSGYTQDLFGYDQEHVFLDGVIVDVDRDSFTEISNGYFKDKDFVYQIRRDDYDKHYLVQYKRDLSTFKVFVASGANIDYTMDKNGVYYSGEQITGIDPTTFALVSSPAEIEGLNAKGGPTLTEFYMRDASHVVHRGKILFGADSDTFVPINTGGYIQEYGKDMYSVFYRSTLITGADPETFMPLSRQVYEGCGLGNYSIDKNAVYFEGIKVEGADPGTFKALYNAYGKDENNVYLRGVPQKDLDPDTFTSECNYG